ncbi:unnamed protein product [Cochlearia groenlandica]
MASLSSSSLLPSPSLDFLSSLSPTMISSASFHRNPSLRRTAKKNQMHVVAMAPEEEKLTRRNPLDFPIEWERPKPGRRPDIFPKFSPMKTPLPPPMPYDPPEEDEEEEEKKEEEEENPDQEEEEQPDKQS